MKRLIIAAVGLALVGGIIIGGMVGNPFGASVQHTSAAAVTGSGCYTNWDSTNCAAGYTAVSVGQWTVIFAQNPNIGGGPATMVCAAPKVEDYGALGLLVFLSGTAQNLTVDNRFHVVNHEPCATCCATSASVVGGVAEAPDFAAGRSGIGGAYAVLGAVGAVLAITVAGTVAAKRRGGQQ